MGGNVSSPCWPPGGWRRRGLLVYSIFCTLVAGCAAARFTLMFTPDLTYGEAVFSRTIVMSIYTQAAIFVGIFICAGPKMISFINGFAAHARSLHAYRVKIYRGVRILVALIIVLGLIGIAVFLYFVFKPEMGLEVRMWAVPWDKDDLEARVSLSWLLVMFLPGLCTLFLIESLYVIISYCIFKEVNALADEMEAMASSGPTSNDVKWTFSVCRKIHSKLADIMDEADGIFSKFIAVAILEFLFSICLSLYNFSEPDIPLFNFYYLSIIACLELQYFAILFAGSIYLNSVVSTAGAL